MACVIPNVGVWLTAVVPFRCLPSLAALARLSANTTASLHPTIGVRVASGRSEFVVEIRPEAGCFQLLAGSKGSLTFGRFHPHSCWFCTGTAGNSTQAPLGLRPGFMLLNS